MLNTCTDQGRKGPAELSWCGHRQFSVPQWEPEQTYGWCWWQQGIPLPSRQWLGIMCHQGGKLLVSPSPTSIGAYGERRQEEGRDGPRARASSNAQQTNQSGAIISMAGPGFYAAPLGTALLRDPPNKHRTSGARLAVRQTEIRICVGNTFT